MNFRWLHVYPHHPGSAARGGYDGYNASKNTVPKGDRFFYDAMDEVNDGKTKDVAHLATVQYASADQLHARWDLYDFCVPPIDLFRHGIERLRLAGDESVLDIGCGDGSVLLDLRLRDGHRGRLVGLELNDGMFAESVARAEREAGSLPVEYVVGTGERLPFSDQSFDVVLAFFVLYHLPDISIALQEWRRVLKPGGKLLAATSSTTNRPRHKALKDLVGQLTKTRAGSQFSSSFNLENGEAQLGQVFTVTDRFVYDGVMRLTDPEVYLRSLDSVRDMFQPMSSDADWQQARGEVGKKIGQEIQIKGFFEDRVHRGYFICSL